MKDKERSWRYNLAIANIPVEFRNKFTQLWDGERLDSKKEVFDDFGLLDIEDDWFDFMCTCDIEGGSHIEECRTMKFRTRLERLEAKHLNAESTTKGKK